MVEMVASQREMGYSNSLYVFKTFRTIPYV